MNITPASLAHTISTFLRRFHVLIFTIVVLGGLAVCMFLINAIIAGTGENSAEVTNAAAATSSGFDQQTIARIKQLHAADDPNKPGLDTSSGRVNLFVDEH